MRNYIPKLSHAVFTALMSVSFSLLWSITQGRTAQVMIFAAVLFLFISGLVMLMVIDDAHYNSRTAYIEALVKMDSETRNALAFNVPVMRLVARRGQVQTLFDDTRATIDHFHLFLQDSTNQQTASKRNWHTSERPAWAWQEIYDYLRARNMVGAFSVGPDSYPWNGTAYQNLCVYFLSQSVANLNDDPRVYASEVEGVEV